MTKQTINSLLSIIAISVLNIGCGSSSVSVKTTTGTVIDDYIKGATVCLDINNNGQRDAEDTPCAQTNATGQFVLATNGSTLPLVVSGGRDVASGKAFTGTYTAPAGSTVINPLTTIVQAIVQSGATITSAQATVKTSLGLPDVDLTTYDPIAALNNPATVEDAKTVFAQQSSIQTILSTIAATVAASAAGTSTQEADVTNTAVRNIAALMTATETPIVIDIASAANVATIITQTAITEDVTVDPVLITAIAEQVSTTSIQVIASIDSTSTSISDIRVAAAQISTVVQTNTAAAVTAIEAGTDPAVIAETLDAIDANALTEAIANVTIVNTNLETIATEETQPTINDGLTGAQGGN